MCLSIYGLCLFPYKNLFSPIFKFLACGQSILFATFFSLLSFLFVWGFLLCFFFFLAQCTAVPYNDLGAVCRQSARPLTESVVCSSYSVFSRASESRQLILDCYLLLWLRLYLRILWTLIVLISWVRLPAWKYDFPFRACKFYGPEICSDPNCKILWVFVFVHSAGTPDPRKLGQSPTSDSVVSFYCEQLTTWVASETLQTRRT